MASAVAEVSAKVASVKPMALEALSELVTTKEDFEAEAREQISAEQLETEIAKLEQELAAEAP